jgi:hypothetical protein
MFALYYFKFYTIFRLFNVGVLYSCSCAILYFPLNDKWQTAVLQLAICELGRVGLACRFENHGGYLGAADAEQEDA